MNIKITKKPTGIPECTIACAPGTTDLGVRQVTMFLRAIDAHGIGDGVGRIVLSPAEARVLGLRLLSLANEADPFTPGKTNA